MSPRSRYAQSAPAVTLILILTTPIFAQAPASAAPADKLARPEAQTVQLRLLVLTTNANAGSNSTFAELSRKVPALAASTITVSELPVDGDARFDPQSLPKLMLYRSSDRGNELVGQKEGPVDAVSALAWLRSDPLISQVSKKDSALARTQYATPQIPLKVPPEIPPAVTPPAAPAAQPQSIPVLMTPPQPAPVAAPVVQVPSASPFGISVPSAPIVVTPSAPSVYVTPAPPPNVYVTQAAPAAPNVYVAQAPTPPQQLFVASPSAIPMAPVPSQVLVAAPTLTAAPQALAPQPTQNALIVHSPSLIDHLIGTVGEQMAKRKWPRVQLGQAPLVSTPVSTVPVQVQAQAYAAGPQALPPTPQPLSSPPAQPLASPQGESTTHAKHPGLFHKRP